MYVEVTGISQFEDRLKRRLSARSRAFKGKAVKNEQSEAGLED